jgi:pimeloyl-ACP methyl ester carboxylesterase
MLFCIFSLSPAQEISPPSITDTILIRDWLLCGPFSIGTREGITEAIDDLFTLQPRKGDSLRTGLVQGGVAHWKRVQTDSSGWLETDYSDVRWDSIQDYYGISGLAAAGYAYGEFNCPRRSRALAVTTRLGSFILNGKSYLGDIYGNNWFKAPVILDSGINRIFLRLSGYGDQRVRFLLIPAEKAVLLLKEDITAPDLVAESSCTAWLGIPLLNTTTEILSGVMLRLAIDTFVLTETVINHIPALAIKKPALQLHLPALPYDTQGYKLLLTVRLRNFEYVDTIKLRSRLLTQAHKKTFLSEIDSSCQYYALLYPEQYDPKRKYALILSLHGAGVESYSLAECFKPKDWAFVVCPTNRRPYGFDWQDWGRIDALEVLNVVKENFPIDPDRVVLTGHSMGGHGTWHIGLAHPDLFAALGPEAGWPSFPLYVPNFLQRSAIFTEPAKLSIREMAARPDNAPAFLENALNLPVFILHGGDDDNVPTIHGRSFALWLDALRLQYHYKEVPGQKHWWNYPDGIVCVDDPDLMAFLKESRRNPGPRHIKFRTPDLAQSRSCYWLTIDRVKTVGRDATVEVVASDSTINITTINIAQLTLNLDQRLFFSRPVSLKMDGEMVVPRVELPAVLTLHQTAGVWKLGQAKTKIRSKKPGVYGPAKEALMRPFAIVYGTQNPTIADFLRHAATQEALRWYLIGNGTADVLADTESIPLDRNLILLGGAAENIFVRRISDKLPIAVHQGKMKLTNIMLGNNLGAIFVYPNPLNPERLLLIRMGTDPKATKLSLFFNIIGSGTSVPDFMIFDDRVRRFGWQGVRAAGFFSPDWELEPASAFIER